MDLFQRYAEEILSKSGRISEIIGHAPSIGTYHEEIIREFLRSVLTNRFAVRSGFIYNQDKKASSRQLDIIIIDENDPSAYYLRQGEFVIAKPRAVICAIEIKTRMNAHAFRDIARHAFEFRKIVGAGRFSGQFFGFCLRSDNLTIEKIANYYSRTDIPDDVVNYPNTLSIMDFGFLGFGPEKFFDPPGVYLYTNANSAKSTEKIVLAHFLSTILKICEVRAGIKGNAYADNLGTAQIRLLHHCFTYGVGRRDGVPKPWP